MRLFACVLAILGIAVTSIQCGSGVGCLGNCEELSAAPGTSDLIFAGASGVDRIEANSVRINWVGVAEAAEYLVFDVTATPVLLARLPGSASSYTALFLQTGATYQFRVKLLDPLKRTDTNTNNVSATTLASTAEALASFPSPLLLKLWLKSTSGVTIESDKVASLADQSGNGNDLSQIITAKRPQLIEGALNGLPAIKFAGTQFLSGTNLSFINPHHIFFVFSSSSAAGGEKRILFTDGDPGGGGASYGVIANGSEFYMEVDTPAALGANLQSDVFTFGTLSSTGLIGGLLTTSARANGIDGGQNNIAGPVGQDGLTFGGGTSFVGRDLAELLFYTSVLPDAERDLVEAYLKERYAL